MAKANVFLLSIVLMASLGSLSQAIWIYRGLLIGTLQVRGVLRCTLNGNPNTPPVSVATVFLRCDGSSTNLGQALTNQAGDFYIVAKISDTAFSDPSSCRVLVSLPVATCSVFPRSGAVSSGITLVGVVQTNNGNIANFRTGTFLVPPMIIGV